MEHTEVHWKMLRFGIRTKNSREMVGQLPRLLVGGVKSFVGKVPIGNTGGANVPPLWPVPIAAECRPSSMMDWQLMQGIRSVSHNHLSIANQSFAIPMPCPYFRGAYQTGVFQTKNI
jgi:hypothetical protein